MPNNFHEACKILVGKFCDNPNWGREVKIAKKLLHLSPDIEAWQGIDLGYKLNSLAYFLGDGKDFIPTSQRNPYLLDLTETPKVKDVKVPKRRGRPKKVKEGIEKTEESPPNQMSKSMFEFLN